MLCIANLRTHLVPLCTDEACAIAGKLSSASSCMLVHCHSKHTKAHSKRGKVAEVPHNCLCEADSGRSDDNDCGATS